MRTLASSVLVAEALVIFFAVLVAMRLSGVDPATVWSVGGGLAGACLLLCGLLRFRWAYWAGSFLQVLVVAAGLVVPAMFFLGPLFAVLWVVGLVLGARVDTLKRARRDQHA
ncbi:MAG: DUF4233 domain-containing protein [Carbonactinosporaceae bacterium]